jgi:hypothetical protein
MTNLRAVPALEPPVPMVLGSATDKSAAELREELQRWTNAVLG